jgi:RimJ/RimL family protein N-acetyltransferase
LKNQNRLLQRQTYTRETRPIPVNRLSSNLKWTDGLPSRLPLIRKFGIHRTTLRFLSPDDAAKLMVFFSSHTPDTIYSRYGSFVHMSPEHAAQLVGVNQSRDCALGVFEGRTGMLIAIGRYCLDASGGSAEVAFVVRESRRGLGIATALLRELLLIARKRGLAKLTAQVEHNNHAMMEIFRRVGAAFTEHGYGDAIKVTLGLGKNLLPEIPMKIRVARSKTSTSQ